MIFISDDVTCGSGRFCFELMKSIRPKFIKHFDDETIQDFDNDLEFQKMIWFSDLTTNDFNFVSKSIENIKMDKQWLQEKQILVDFLKADPRYTV